MAALRDMGCRTDPARSSFSQNAFRFFDLESDVNRSSDPGADVGVEMFGEAQRSSRRIRSGLNRAALPRHEPRTSRTYQSRSFT